MNVYNEEDILNEVLDFHIQQGILFVITDNGSTDKSWNILKEWEKHPNILAIKQHYTDTFQLDLFTYLGFKFASQYQPDWIIHSDCSYFLENPPHIKGSFIEHLQKIDQAGYNLINLKLYDFYPTEKDDPNEPSVHKRLKYYCPRDSNGLFQKHEKVFKFHPEIQVKNGHVVHFPKHLEKKPFPDPWIARHYAFRSLDHGLKKLKERFERYDPIEVKFGYHVHYDSYQGQKEFIVKNSKDLAYKPSPTSPWVLQHKMITEPKEKENPPVRTFIYDNTQLQITQQNVKGYIQTLHNKSIYFLKGPDLHLDGWVFSDQPIDQLRIRINSRLNVDGIYGLTRPDVYEVCNKGFYSGFHFQIPVQCLNSTKTHLQIYSDNESEKQLLLEWQGWLLPNTYLPYKNIKRTFHQINRSIKIYFEKQELERKHKSYLKSFSQPLPEVSIIMPFFNAAKHIRKTLHSVLNQNFLNFELILLNDASIDKSESIVLSYRDKRIKYLKNTHNAGTCKSRNIAIRHAKGKYIAYCDHDDFWHPHHLNTLIEAFRKNPEIGMAYTQCEYHYVAQETKKLWYIEWSQKHIEQGYVTTPTTLMHTRSSTEKCGLFSEDPFFINGAGEDWEYWLRISDKVPVKSIPITTCQRYIHSSNRVHQCDTMASRVYILKLRWETIKQRSQTEIDHYIATNGVENLKVFKRQEAWDALTFFVQEFYTYCQIKEIKSIYQSVDHFLQQSCELTSEMN